MVGLNAWSTGHDDHDTPNENDVGALGSLASAVGEDHGTPKANDFRALVDGALEFCAKAADMAAISSFLPES